MSILIAGFDRSADGREITTDDEAVRFYYRPQVPTGTLTLHDERDFVVGVAGNKSLMTASDESVILTHSLYSYSLAMFGSKREQIIFNRRNGSIQLTKEATGKSTKSCQYALRDPMVSLPIVAEDTRFAEEYEEVPVEEESPVLRVPAGQPASGF